MTITAPLFRKTVLGFFLLSPSFLCAAELKYKVSGESAEKAELSTLSPKPDIPSMNSLSFSLDGGRSAIDQEVIPLSALEAAIKSDPSRIALPILPLLPESPFVVQPVPLTDKGELKLKKSLASKNPESTDQFSWEFSIVDEKNNII